MAKKQTKKPMRHIIDDLIIMAFALGSIALLAVEMLGALSSTQLEVVYVLDAFIAMFFLAEFGIRFFKSPNKVRFVFWHWWELLAGIPISSPLLQGFRGLRILSGISLLETLRIFRITARLEVAGELAGKATKHAYLVEVISSLLALIFGSSVLFWSFEQGSNVAVHSLWDAFYWAIATLTTTGYGDIKPTTTGGRTIAIVLMLTGAATMTLVTAALVRYLSTKKGRRIRL